MLIGPGELCALLAPLAWSVAVILYKRSAELPALSMNLFKNGLAVVLLGLTMLAAGIEFPAHRTLEDWGRLAGSGVIGLAIGDTLLFAGLSRIGAARLAVVDTIYAPLMVFLSWAVLGEPLGASFLAGAGAVVAGIALANAPSGPVDQSPADARQLVIGSLLTATSITCTCVGVVLAKPALASGHLVEITWTRLAAGLVAQGLVVLVTGRWRDASQAFTRRDLWPYMLPGAFVGTYLSLMLWLGGFKWGRASVASVLNQMATVYMLALARLWLGEPLRRRQVGGAFLAACGALWIVWAK